MGEPWLFDSRTRCHSEIEEGCVSSSQIHQNIRSAPLLGWDDLIVDVHEKTTTIEVRILCTPPAESLGNTQLAATVSAAPVVVKFR
jgi:hypothetical protein